jgi:hypothetical protein
MTRDQPDCKYESKTLEAMTSGEAPTELVDHWEQCATCRNLRLVVGYLNEVSAEIDQPAVPSPGLIWWRAQLETKRQLAARSVSSIATFEKIAITIAILLGVILIIIFAPRMALATQTWPLVAGGAFAMLLVPAIAILYLWSRSDRSPVGQSSGHLHSMI